ncbi:flagellar assembly peptidoglycan hydrolase FlgJ [Chitinivorax sp. PXF-14]|uniref:flagellar assembly peptidoglycan hydrolase FlgJ n=1 Tax=Chitinivorax sp. PXF-14 TaxID=3230488 RepID=UPI0034669DC0
MRTSSLPLSLGATSTPAVDLGNRLSLDVGSLDALKQQAKTDNKAALKGVAQQFESLFLQMMLKNMRNTVPESELSGSNELKTFTGMFDDQLAQKIASGRGIGFADMIVKQLSREHVYQPGKLPADASLPKAVPVKPVADKAGVAISGHATATQFADTMLAQAKPAADQLGVSPHVLVAQAALETGWGKRVIRDANGGDSHNVFGIKAGKDWTGPVAEVTTTEYVNGKPEKRVERFRVYGSHEEAFNDYAKLLAKNGRYREALNQGDDAAGFASALQQGGYATDPQYAAKLTRVANHQVLRRAAIAAYQQWT